MLVYRHRRTAVLAVFDFIGATPRGIDSTLFADGVLAVVGLAAVSADQFACEQVVVIGFVLFLLHVKTAEL